MFAFRHVILLFCYAGLAASAAVFLPQWVPRLDGTMALLAAAIVFVAGGVLHENYARVGRESQLADQLLAQHRAYAELEEELTWTRREVKAVRDAVETVARARQDGAGGEVVAELKVLKSLLGKMAESRRQAPAAPKAASKPRAVAAP